MKNTQRFILIHSFMAVLAFSQSAFAAPACVDLFTDKNEPAAHEHVKAALVAGKLTKLVRSNARQNWAWYKKFAKDYLSPEVLGFTGNIDGDPHNGNYAPIIVNGKIEWRLVDYDDAGVGPFVLDFAKFVGVTKSVDSIKKVKVKDMWDAYLRGLEGKAYEEVPDFVQELLDMTPERFRDLEVKKATKFSSGDKLLNDGEKSSAITKLVKKGGKLVEVFDQAKYDLVMETVRRSLPEGFTVLDVGGREKGGGTKVENPAEPKEEMAGGSADAIRFVALVKGKDGRNTIFELKQDSESGIDAYQPQQSTLEQILDFHVYRGQKSDGLYSEVQMNIDGSNLSFNLRPKPLYFFDYANKAKTKNQFEEFEGLTLYNSWIKGRMQSGQKQAAAYLKALKKEGDDGKTYNGIKDMTWAYLELLESYLPE